MVSQHVQNITTLSDQENQSLLKQIEKEQGTKGRDRVSIQVQEAEAATPLPPVVPEGIVTRGKKKKAVSFTANDEDVERFINVGIKARPVQDIYHDNVDPKTFKQAMKQSDQKLWQEAIDKEINAIIANKTWSDQVIPKF